MANLNLPNVRQESDIRFNVSLKDNGVTVDWASLTNIKAYAYSDSQVIMAGELEATVDEDDSTNLIVDYDSGVPQYLGIARLLIRATYSGRKKTFDKAVVNFVADTASATGVTVITDPTISVALTVTEVSTSLLDEAIDACVAATAEATASASHQPVIDSTTKHWKIWDPSTSAYVDSGVVAEGQDGEDGEDGEDGATGPAGPTGPQGEAGTLSYPTFSINAAMHLQATALTTGDVSRFAISSGHLQLTI